MRMQFLTNGEKKINKRFLNNGYIILKNESIISFRFVENLILDEAKKILNIKKKLDLNYLHNYIGIRELNEFRLRLIFNINKNKLFRYHYFNLARVSLYNLAGNELMMQKNINLSIQFPKDDSSLLPIHSDVWSGDSPYEINLWLPMVDCYKTKSMYILSPKENLKFNKIMKRTFFDSSEKIYLLLKNKLKWLNVKKGKFLLFNQALPHGNIVNTEIETRVSMNCRFKNIFYPYGDKKIGEFFYPITSRATTIIGNNFESPFEK